MNRRHDIDALRALAFALVIVYHVGMYYVAGWGWHIKSPHAAEWLQWPMRALNLWRMDLVFLISGLSIGFLWRGDGAGSLIRTRSLRLLVPLAFGMAVIVPYQPYAQAVANGATGPGFLAFLARYYTGGPWPKDAFDGAHAGVTWNHLWYLPYLWLYTVVLALLGGALRSPRGLRLRAAFNGLRGIALVTVPVLPLVLYSLVLWPRFPVTHDLIGDVWMHAVYFTLFLYGWWIGTDEGFWTEVARLRWPLLTAAVFLLALHFSVRAAVQMGAPGLRLAARICADFYLWSCILAILGWGHALLNRPWRWLAWANESVYPWYILHQTLIILFAVWLAPLRLGPWMEPAVLLAATVLGCWVLTDLAIRRAGWLRPLFGLRPRVPSRYPCAARPAYPSARSG